MLYVSIGRNVGQTPMGDDRWEEFRLDVRHAIGKQLGAPDTVAFGESHYGGDPEQTCVMVWFDLIGTLDGSVLDDLAILAGHYGQESIAWSVAETNFIVGVSA
jgi:hypothetical protein